MTVGKAKKVGIGVGIVVAFFAIVIMIGASSSTVPETINNSIASTAANDISKYEGLTEEQIRSIKLISEACSNKVTEAEVLYGEERGRLVQEQCDRAVGNRIADYKAKNAATHEPVDTTTAPASDFRCFQRFNTIMDVDENSWYAVTLYNELETEVCDRDWTGVQYGVPIKLDILRASQDIEIDQHGQENPLYTEYRLMNGTILAFGEKDVKQG